MLISPDLIIKNYQHVLAFENLKTCRKKNTWQVSKRMVALLMPTPRVNKMTPIKSEIA